MTKSRGIRAPYKMKVSTEERFARLCAEPDENGCIRWLGRHNNKGYAQFRFDGKWGLAHIYVWERSNGPVPKGLEVDHVHSRGCRAPDCVNLAHLEPVTRAENMARARSANREKTHCAHGHEYTEANTYRRPEGGRRCRKCHVICERKRLGRSEVAA